MSVLKKHYYVYKIICDHPASLKKYYIGQRSCNCLPEEDTTYWSSSRYIREAIQCYGLEWFRKRILSTYTNRKDALEVEIRLHWFFNVRDNPLFFNQANQCSTGFSCGRQRRGKKQRSTEKGFFLKKQHSLETRQKMSQAHTGKKFTPEHCEKLSEANKNKPLSQERKERISQSLKGKKRSAATRAKISAAHKGKSLSQAHKKAISEGQRLRLQKKKKQHLSDSPP